MLHQIAKWKFGEVKQVVSESVDCDEGGTWSDVHLMSHAYKNTQNVDEQMILVLSQVS